MRFHSIDNHAKSMLFILLVNASNVSVEKDYLMQGFLFEELLSLLLGPWHLSASHGCYLSYFSHLFR